MKARKAATPRVACERPRHARHIKQAPDARRLQRVREALVRWGHDEGRHFFWREPALPAFAVLVTEILLTKTRAEMVEPVARILLERFRHPSDLARAHRRNLERLLYPLGLHRKRARGLIACANSLMRDHGGEVPRSVTELMQLPHVGRYAANAVASVAFHQTLPAIDANVARVLQRVFSLPPPPVRLSTAHELWSLAGRMLPEDKAKEFNWAVLDLGAIVCMPRNPACHKCPIARNCDLARASRTVASAQRRC